MDTATDNTPALDVAQATTALGALAQEHRLRTFRLLVQAGPAGLPAGDIARALDLRHNTLSTHLASLVQGGLVTSRRDGRSIIYSVDFAGTRALLAYLVEDCCQGSAELCGAALETVLPGCCTPDTATGAPQ